MQLMVIESHDGEGRFPTFIKGTSLKKISPCGRYDHWIAVQIDEYETFVPECYILKERLVRNYNPTELVIGELSIVNLLEIAYEWALVETIRGDKGWLPCYKLKSI
ncbi:MULTISPECIES: hypothetical protein [Enterococcus]|uniref:hypothetical protein n=1 Tax=Enterococcus TaxID=1350 RepID=UPI002DB778A6|nr:hypothetical protein [Enterococcus faecalis]MEB8383837.1 hypothetical protein [Enterococcus faecalis]